MEEMVNLSVNIQLVRIRLVILVDREHGIGMDHIVSAPIQDPMTQVGCTTVLAMYKKKKCHQSIKLYVKMKQMKLFPLFSSAVKK
jgi:hypothetical protein